jgi:hypothetical protein
MAQCGALMKSKTLLRLKIRPAFEGTLTIKLWQNEDEYYLICEKEWLPMEILDHPER